MSKHNVGDVVIVNYSDEIHLGVIRKVVDGDTNSKEYLIDWFSGSMAKYYMNSPYSEYAVTLFKENVSKYAGA